MSSLSVPLSDSSSSLSSPPPHFRYLPFPCLSMHRWNVSSTLVQHTLVCFAGFGSSDKKEKSRPLNSPLSHPPQKQIGDQRLNTLSCLKVDDHTNTRNLQWKHVNAKSPPFPREHSALCSVRIDDRLLLVAVGGRKSPKDIFADMHVLEYREACNDKDDQIDESCVWQKVDLDDEQAKLIARFRHVLFAVNEKRLFVFGGLIPCEHKDKCCTQIEGNLIEIILTYHQEHWTATIFPVKTTGHAPSPRFSHAVDVNGHFVRCLGGFETLQQALSSGPTDHHIYCLDTLSMHWTRSTAVVNPQNLALACHNMHSFGKWLIIIGGVTSSQSNLVHSWRNIQTFHLDACCLTPQPLLDHCRTTTSSIFLKHTSALLSLSPQSSESGKKTALLVVAGGGAPVFHFKPVFNRHSFYSITCNDDRINVSCIES